MSTPVCSSRKDLDLGKGKAAIFYTSGGDTCGIEELTILGFFWKIGSLLGRSLFSASSSSLGVRIRGDPWGYRPSQ